MYIFHHASGKSRGVLDEVPTFESEVLFETHLKGSETVTICFIVERNQTSPIWPRNWKVALEVDQATRFTNLLEAYRATGSTYLWANIRCEHCVSVLSCPNMKKLLDTSLLLLLYLHWVRSGGSFTDNEITTNDPLSSRIPNDWRVTPRAHLFLFLSFQGSDWCRDIRCKWPLQNILTFVWAE